MKNVAASLNFHVAQNYWWHVDHFLIKRKCHCHSFGIDVCVCVKFLLQGVTSWRWTKNGVAIAALNKRNFSLSFVGKKDSESAGRNIYVLFLPQPHTHSLTHSVDDAGCVCKLSATKKERHLEMNNVAETSSRGIFLGARAPRAGWRTGVNK